MSHVLIKKIYLLLFVLIITSLSCKKDWLSVKRDKALIVPTTLADMRLLLNSYFDMGPGFRGTAELSADDYYVTTTTWLAFINPIEKDAYIWSNDVFKTTTNLADWNKSYYQVLTSNVILEGIKKISRTSENQKEWDDIKGAALFIRANAFWNLAQLFAKPYDAATATSDLGIPLRLESDINLPTVRSTVKETYDQIIMDLEEAVNLSILIPANKTAISKPAVYALLARVYLSMREYAKAFTNSDLCLQNFNTLLNFNTLNGASTYPIPLFNNEIILMSEVDPTYSSFRFANGLIDPNFIATYDTNDLRKTLYFRDNGNGTFGFRGNFSGQFTLFMGISTNEMYLIRAECNARADRTTEALQDLNTLLASRFKTNTYVPYSAPNATAALNIILMERRKELLRRALRWTDLRRLNKEPAHAITVTRTVNGQTYTLQPNDPKYVLPIPEYIIQQTGIQQNPR